MSILHLPPDRRPRLRRRTAVASLVLLAVVSAGALS